MNKNITIAGILIIMGIIAYSSYNEAENNKIEEVQKQAKVKQIHLEEQEKRKSEIEKAYLNMEAEKAKKDAEIEKARLQAESQRANRIKQQQEVKAQLRVKQRERCVGYIDILKGQFNIAKDTFWHGEKALLKVENDAIKMKLKCPDNRSEFQEIVNKCIDQLK